MAETFRDQVVWITGGGTGIGRSLAEALAAQGAKVVVSGRREQPLADTVDAITGRDGIALAKVCDVADTPTVDRTVREIVDLYGRLDMVIANAGFAVAGTIESLELDDWRRQFDVNVFGVFRVTKAFAPMILESKGRIINISSISGVLSGGGYGMYAGSKHALEAMTDALSNELEKFGVHVAAVNPGNFASEIGLTRCKRLLADTDADDWGLFEDRRQQMLSSCKERVEAGVENEGTPPDAVARTVQRALFEDHPRDRYLIVPRQVEAGWTIAKATEEMLNLNLGHEYSYTRDEIVALIDSMWPYASGEKSGDDPEQEAELMAFMEAWMERREQAD